MSSVATSEISHLLGANSPIAGCGYSLCKSRKMCGHWQVLPSMILAEAEEMDNFAAWRILSHAEAAIMESLPAYGSARCVPRTIF